MATGTQLRLSVMESLRIVRDALSEATPNEISDILTGTDPMDDVARRIMAGVDGLADEDRRTIAFAALQAVSSEIDPTTKAMGPRDAARIKAAIRHMTGTINGAGRPDQTRTEQTMSVAAQRPTTTTPEAFRNLARSIGDGPKTEGGEQPTTARETKAVTPFHENRIDRSTLKGMDVMIARATNNQITRAEDLFARLGQAERRVVELEEQDRTATASGASRNDETPPTRRDEASAPTWRRRTVRLGDVIPTRRAFARTQATGGDPQPGIDLTRLMNTTVTVIEGGTQERVPKVDEDYVFDARTLATAMHAVRAGKNLCLVGPTGSGKTKFLEQLAARLNRPYFRISVDGEMRRREIIGGLQQVVTDKGSRTAWYDGLLTVAIGMPSIVNLDEIDRADADMLYAAAQVLEGNGIQLLEDGNRHIPMHPWCMIASTGNTKGQADANGLYASTGEMSEASRDRINLWVDHEYMEQDAEVALIMAKVPGTTEQDARTITAIAADVRLAMRDGRLRTACSPRTTLAAAEYLADMLPLMTGTTTARAKQACVEQVLAARARDPFDAKAIAQMIQNRMGGAAP